MAIKKVTMTLEDLPGIVDQFLNQAGQWNEFVKFVDEMGYEIDSDTSLEFQVIE